MADTFMPFPSRRSTVYSTTGIVACTQPLAAQAGQRILAQGGNAADAAVAVAAALNVTEPCNTGIGGDAFCLFYSAKDKSVRGLNASGRAAKGLSVEQLREKLGAGKDGSKANMPLRHAVSATVPGAAAGWVDTVEKFGSGNVTLADVLKPAIELAESGFPMSAIAARFWGKGEDLLRQASPNYAEMLRKDPEGKDGVRSPREGELMHNPTIAKTFRALGEHGRKGFYEGRVAEELIKVLQAQGSSMTLEDLRDHCKHGSQEIEPISMTFAGQGLGQRDGGVRLWECPPNGQGIVALMALAILEELEKGGKIARFESKDHNSPAYLHAVVESLRIAFADAAWWVADPDVAKVPTKGLLDRAYLQERAKLFDASKASASLDHGSPAHQSSDTVYFAVTDRHGNGCSFINSNYSGFGTGIIPAGCGFTVQNRGSNFNLREGHPNVYAPGKRPYHTIIPAMATGAKSNDLLAVMGVMGGFMQPQGHIQVLLNMLVFGHSAQSALDAPRICIGAGLPDAGNVEDRTVFLEDGIPTSTVEGLRKLGHTVTVVQGHDRSLFGRGQIIRSERRRDTEGYSFQGGSDPRGDGAAVPG